MNSKYISITFTPDDVSELYHIIGSRGYSETRKKLLIALRNLDRQLSDRIDESDQQYEKAIADWNYKS